MLFLLFFGGYFDILYYYTTKSGICKGIWCFFGGFWEKIFKNLFTNPAGCDMMISNQSEKEFLKWN